ncbi:DNA-binding CsgD family transcriptional regulator [Kitasatospora sp. MAP12-15]|uniref:helix-turn-helix transcriptional regulator n=1 Tax=unclassified Kitasatospora TaxID=2633591 RepID=UPI002475FD12|nr:LuxR C-terminal-related transcriptional regulator [Kitasatospora sp. MAP12-44]MDH6114092.1 DNA-binding CsgD family transcriptional regulator [Kitasatospora sp. MAP12-44]
MAPSGEAGLRRIFAVIDLLLDAVDEETLLPALFPALLGAVPGDSLTWSTRTPTGRHPVTAPADLFSPEAVAGFFRYARDDSLFRHTDTGTGVPLRRSDLQSRTEYHRLGTYAEALCPAGVEYQLAMAFPAGWARSGRRTVCLVVNRAGTDFGDADLASATLLRARLTHALDRLAPPVRLPAEVTAREAAVLDLLASGLTDRQIGRRLEVSERTVDKHLEHAYAKLRVHSRVAAATLWREAAQRR